MQSRREKEAISAALATSLLVRHGPLVYGLRNLGGKGCAGSALADGFVKGMRALISASWVNIHRIRCTLDRLRMQIAH